MRGVETLHPLVTVLDLSRAKPLPAQTFNFGLYAVYPKELDCSEFNLSSNYFGDVIKKETRKSAQEYIQSKLIDVAKERIFSVDKSISEVAYELGFSYPQHFTRLFKQRVGLSPTVYRNLN